MLSNVQVEMPILHFKNLSYNLKFRSKLRVQFIYRTYTFTPKVIGKKNKQFSLKRGKKKTIKRPPGLVALIVVS